MIAMQNLLDMICTEAFEGNNGDTCEDFGHELPVIDHRWRMGIDWCRGYPDKLYSLKSKRRAQRRLDRRSRVRVVKRRLELERRCHLIGK